VSREYEWRVLSKEYRGVLLNTQYYKKLVPINRRYRERRIINDDKIIWN